jgi:hypothetical protein
VPRDQNLKPTGADYFVQAVRFVKHQHYMQCDCATVRLMIAKERGCKDRDVPFGKVSEECNTSSTTTLSCFLAHHTFSWKRPAGNEQLSASKIRLVTYRHNLKSLRWCVC